MHIEPAQDCMVLRLHFKNLNHCKTLFNLSLTLTRLLFCLVCYQQHPLRTLKQTLNYSTNVNYGPLVIYIITEMF